MRILAIETIGTTGSVALLEGEQVIAEQELNPQQRSAQSLAPGIQQLLAANAWQPADVQLVAVATGPGSFTGLRIGVTTAKLLAYGVGCQVQGVDSLAAIAAQSPANVQQVTVALDAGRGEFYSARYQRDAAGAWLLQGQTQVVAQSAWLAALESGHYVSGAALAMVADRLPAGVVPLDDSCRTARAATIGRLGWRQYASGVRTSPVDLLPHYYRRTAAEEQWERRHV